MFQSAALSVLWSNPGPTSQQQMWDS